MRQRRSHPHFRVYQPSHSPSRHIAAPAATPAVENVSQVDSVYLVAPHWHIPITIPPSLMLKLSPHSTIALFTRINTPNPTPHYLTPKSERQRRPRRTEQWQSPYHPKRLPGELRGYLSSLAFDQLSTTYPWTTYNMPRSTIF